MVVADGCPAQETLWKLGAASNKKADGRLYFDRSLGLVESAEALKCDDHGRSAAQGRTVLPSTELALKEFYHNRYRRRIGHFLDVEFYAEFLFNTEHDIKMVQRIPILYVRELIGRRDLIFGKA